MSYCLIVIVDVSLILFHSLEVRKMLRTTMQNDEVRGITGQPHLLSNHHHHHHIYFPIQTQQKSQKIAIQSEGCQRSLTAH